MIDAIIAGRLHSAPAERTSASGNRFVVAKVTAASGNGEQLFVGVIAFSQTARTALLALEPGDSVALSGSLTPKTWTDRNGEARATLDLVAHAVLTPYHVRRKRKAVSLDEQAPAAAPAPARATTPPAVNPPAGNLGFDDMEDDV